MFKLSRICRIRCPVRFRFNAHMCGNACSGARQALSHHTLLPLSRYTEAFEKPRRSTIVGTNQASRVSIGASQVNGVGHYMPCIDAMTLTCASEPVDPGLREGRPESMESVELGLLSCFTYITTIKALRLCSNQARRSSRLPHSLNNLYTEFNIIS